MPRSRTTEAAQKQSPRGGPSNIRTSSSNSDPLHHRPRPERSLKLSEGRSPRGSQSDPPLNQKKLGTRIADLESQLGLAQEELKCLKDQLVSAEAAKIAAQDQLVKKSSKPQKASDPVEIQALNKEDAAEETSDAAQKETDVFEVPIQKVAVETKSELELPADESVVKPNPISPISSLADDLAAVSEPENPVSDELALKNDEIKMLKAGLDEKTKELDVFRRENERLKSELDDKSLKISSAQSEIDELTVRLSRAEEELEKSKSNGVEISKKLEAGEKAKEELEAEMKRLCVQTEQWRKAADAAASVLSGGAEMNGRRISERCGSMDKHFGYAFEPIGDYVGAPGLIYDADDDFGSGKRKGSGIKMFGDLWRKKGQK